MLFRIALVALAAAAVAAVAVSASAAPSRTYEDTRAGFPKIAAYRPGCSVGGGQAAVFDWFVTDGACPSAIDAGYRLNRRLLGMIQPSGPNGDLFAATYGQYDRMTSAVRDPRIGTIRPFRTSDWVADTSGGVHEYGTVEVLDWSSLDTAIWSADVMAYWAKRNGALAKSHPGIAGIWGDNDFWGDQTYAFTGTKLESSALRATWDTNDVIHHQRLAKDLPGMIIGGNDIASYSDDPGSYRGRQKQGWLLRGLSSAGMRECADRYFGLYDPHGVDMIVRSAQRFLAGKGTDRKQRFLMLNNCSAASTEVNEYSLAVATIAGMYYWPYTDGDWSTTLSIAPSIPDVARNGRRHWLGAPTGAPQQLASGFWKRTFQHGVVYANMSGSPRSADGHTVGNQVGLFIAR
jgi:hypothetical protein